MSWVSFLFNISDTTNLPSNASTATTIIAFSNMHFSTFSFNYKVYELGLQEAYTNYRGNTQLRKAVDGPAFPASREDWSKILPPPATRYNWLSKEFRRMCRW